MKTFYRPLAVLFLLIFSISTYAQIFVNQAATGNNHGGSWEDAFTSLHAALEVYSTGEEIWVAAGTYLPGQSSSWPGDPENTFYIYQDVKIYGGFNGTELLLSERDPVTNITILSGDINGDDVDDDFETNREDNATTVVFVDTIVSSSTVIDGFTISNGHAAGDTNVVHQIIGAGIMAWGAPQIGHCRFTQNYALAGSGLYLRGEPAAETSVNDCIFDYNEAGEAAAGMAVITGDSSKVIPISNCQFIGNKSVRLGAGLGVGYSSVEVTNCDFTANVNEVAGGGIFFFVIESEGDDYTFNLTDCDFNGNISGNGGAFYYETDSNGNNDISLTSCNFTGNQAVGSSTIEFPHGGALQFLYYGENETSLDSISISECAFQENTAERTGGALTFWNGQGAENFFEINNSTFTENNSITFGGGIYFHTYGGDQMEANITECEFENNASTDGGGMVLFSTNGEYNNFNITSCDFTGNTATELSLGDTPDGGGIYINFQDPGDNLRKNSVTIEDCTLQSNSAEQRGGGILVFNNIGNDNSVNVNNCDLSGNLSDNAGGGMFLGNFGGTDFELNVSELDFTENSSNHGGAFYYASNSGVNNFMQFSTCNFTGNRAITSPNFQFPDGGALGFQYLTSGNPTNDSIIIGNSIFSGNAAERLGGGIAFFNSSGTDNYFALEDCEFSNNDALGSGGGIAFSQFDGGATVSGTVWHLSDTGFENNAAANGGGVAFIGDVGTEGEYIISNCGFEGNEAVFTPIDNTPAGGGLLVQYSGSNFQNNNFLIEDCDLNLNSAETFGGGLIYFTPLGSENHFEIKDCEITQNHSTQAGGGLAIAEGGMNNTALVVNTLFDNNTSPISMAVGVGRELTLPAAVGQHTEFINCLVSNHSDELGEAVVMEVSAPGVAATLTNCTFANNEGPILSNNFSAAGGDIHLRNNILDGNGSPSYLKGPNGDTGTVQSQGGNLVSDSSLDSLLNGADQSGASPMFESGTFQLSQNSPAVDAGILLDNTPATDFAGNDRIQGSCIDIGAFESTHDAGNACLTTNTREALAASTTLFIYPNPVAETANISIENDWTGEMKLRIVNSLGQIVYTTDFEKYEYQAFTEFDASGLLEGIYRVTISNGEQMAVSSFVK